MRKILKIAATELCTLFYSPIAWLILIIFTVQAGMQYVKVIDIMLMQQFSRPLWYSIAKELLTGAWGIFPNMLGHLYLYIPLLTMGLMSREFSSGSIKLLYSSPVSSFQIIFGKYLSMMVYALILVAIVLVFVGFTILHVPHFDISLLLSGILGFYLVVCAYAAIGLFMSCLTSYQVVAAVATLAVLTFLNYVGNIGQGIPFVQDITYWLSIFGRSDQLIDGLICSEDVLYFLIVIALFVTLSVMKIQAGKTKRTKSVAAMRYGGVAVVAMLLGYITSRPGLMCYYDASSIKVNSLTAESQEIMKQLDGGMTITTYVNLLDDERNLIFPAMANSDKAKFKKYIRFKPEIEMKYVYYYADAGNEALNELYPNLDLKQKAWRVATLNGQNIERFLTPEEIDKQIDLSGEEYRFVRQIERASGEKAFLRIFEDGSRDPREAELSAAMKRLVMKSPKVYFLTGHGERDINKAGDKDYRSFTKDRSFRYALINNGFDVVSLSLAEIPVIPEEVSVLVIADVQSPLSEDELQKIDQYIGRGGNLVIAGEPGTSGVMNPITRPLGVRFEQGTLVQPTGSYADDLLICRFVEPGVNVMTAYLGLFRNTYVITMPGTAVMSYDTTAGFRVAPVLSTYDKGSWNELETVNFTDEKAVLNVRAGEVEQTYPTLLALTRQVGDREQRVVVLGDADCMSNAELLMNRRGVRAANFNLITGMFRWLSYEEFPLVLSAISPQDKVLELTKDSMTWVRVGLLWVLPGLFVLGYIGIWLKRRRR